MIDSTVLNIGGNVSDVNESSLTRHQSSEELGEVCLEAYSLLLRLRAAEDRLDQRNRELHESDEARARLTTQLDEAERLYVEACGERDALAMHPPRTLRVTPELVAMLGEELEGVFLRVRHERHITAWERIAAHALEVMQGASLCERCASPPQAPVCLECGMTYLCPRCVDASLDTPNVCANLDDEPGYHR